MYTHDYMYICMVYTNILMHMLQMCMCVEALVSV